MWHLRAVKHWQYCSPPPSRTLPTNIISKHVVFLTTVLEWMSELYLSHALTLPPTTHVCCYYARGTPIISSHVGIIRTLAATLFHQTDDATHIPKISELYISRTLTLPPTTHFCCHYGWCLNRHIQTVFNGVIELRVAVAPPRRHMPTTLFQTSRFWTTILE